MFVNKGEDLLEINLKNFKLFLKILVHHVERV